MHKVLPNMHRQTRVRQTWSRKKIEYVPTDHGEAREFQRKGALRRRDLDAM